MSKVLTEFGVDPTAGPFFRVHAVRSGRPIGMWRPLRVGRPVRGIDLSQQLWGTPGGVFLAGATEQQARQWAVQKAARYGGRVTNLERHGRTGRPHVHVALPNGIRSGHIFWGAAPSGDFFDYDYCG